MQRKRMDFIPSSLALTVVDAKLRLEMGTEKMLASFLNPLCDRYDWILIDACPALGALTISALATANEVTVTVNPQLLAMMGLQDFLKIVHKVQNRISNKLNVTGILLTMCNARTNLCRTIVEQEEDTCKGQIPVF